jgi:hypothetical protein
MILQSPTQPVANPLDTLTAFVTVMIALSVAAERVTETIKQWASPLLAKLGDAGATVRSNSLPYSVAFLFPHSVAKTPSTFPASLPSIGQSTKTGSAGFSPGFWFRAGRHSGTICSILKAAKVQKETAANASLPTDAKIVA